jgi:hypothetical protein
MSIAEQREDRKMTAGVYLSHRVIPAEREGRDSRAIEMQKAFLRERIVPKTNREIIGEDQAWSSTAS